MSSAEFTEWQAYLTVEPQGYDIDTWRWGMMVAHITNAVRSTIATKRKPKVFKPSDFYPFAKDEKADLTPEQRAYIESKRKRRKKK